MANILLMIISFCAYTLGISVDMTSQSTSSAEKNQKPKLIPAEIILLTIPINIGQMASSSSAFRLISDSLNRAYSLFVLVFASIIAYILLLYFGKKIHSRNRSAAFCKTDNDKKMLSFFYSVACIFLVITTVIATL